MTEDRVGIPGEMLELPPSSVVGPRSRAQRVFWCNCGAISVEKMEIVDSMDDRELTPSREKTDISPINAVFSHPIEFEVRRSIH